MHLGRFNSVVQELDKYYSGLGITEALTAASADLSSYASNRTPSILLSFRTRLHDLAKAVEDVPPSFLLPSVTELLNDLNVGNVYGAQLGSRIRALTEISGFPEEVAVAVDNLKSEVSESISDVTALKLGLVRRGVEIVELEPDKAEVGLAYPKELIGESATDLSNELAHISRLFMSMNTMLCRGTEPPTVRTIASSWWQFFLELDAAQIEPWTRAIERIMTLLSAGYAIRENRKKLEQMENIVQPSWIADVEKLELEHYRKGAIDIARELRELCVAQGGAPENVADTENSLRSELLHLLRRINGGAVLEMRLGVEEEKTDDPAAPEAEMSEEVQRLRAEHKERLTQRKQLNAKLAGLAQETAHLKLREDLKLEDQGDAN